jgi:hypothetical protein
MNCYQVLGAPVQRLMQLGSKAAAPECDRYTRNSLPVKPCGADVRSLGGSCNRNDTKSFSLFPRGANDFSSV